MMTGLIVEKIILSRLKQIRCDYGIGRKCFCSSAAVKEIGTESIEIDPDDEFEKKRNKNRLPERIYRVLAKKESEKPIFKTHFTKKGLKKFYGRHGEESGLNPGLMWPTKEEYQDILEHDKMFYRPLEEMLSNVRAKKAEEERERREYEEEVDQNMAKLDQWTKEYNDKIAKKQRDAIEAHERRQLLVEEISSYLGYEVDYKDPRFKEAVEQREKEKKRVKKKMKQEEDYQKMLQKLAVVAEKPVVEEDDDEDK